MNCVICGNLQNDPVRRYVLVGNVPGQRERRLVERCVARCHDDAGISGLERDFLARAKKSLGRGRLSGRPGVRPY